MNTKTQGLSTRDRTQRVKERLCIKAEREIGREYHETGRIGQLFRSGVKLCNERARLLTQSYKKTEGKPWIVRRAEAVSEVLEDITVYIDEDELIVGNFPSDSHSVTWYPEYFSGYLNKAIDSGYRDLVDEEGRQEVKEILAWWKGKSIQDRLVEAVPDDLKPFLKYTGATAFFTGWDISMIDYEKLFKVGLNGVIREVNQKLEELNGSDILNDTDSLSRRDFYTAALIMLKALIQWANRNASKARELAKIEKDEERKGELEKISEICSWVPANQPRTFHEALQFFWFMETINLIIDLPGTGSGVRFDHIFYPFYKKDKEEGRITREQAQELLELLWLKNAGTGHLIAPAATAWNAGFGVGQTYDIGGVDAYGKDATNELSYIVLDASKETRAYVPMLNLRYHDGTPKELVYSAIDLLRTGVGYPAFFNDKAMIPHLLSFGTPLEDARNYAIHCCMVPYIPGKFYRRHCTNGYIVLSKCLELALNKGVDKFSDERLGYPTPDPLTFNSIEDIMEAYLTQVKFFAEKGARLENIFHAVVKDYLPRPLVSILSEGGIEKGRDAYEWTYPYTRLFLNYVGPINVADALAAIKKLIFEDKTVVMEELLDALMDNWAGKEDLRQMFLAAPKFGNDDEYVDLIARDVHLKTNNVIREFKDYHGNPFNGDGSNAGAVYALSYGVGATPDGRRDHEGIADGTVSAMYGRDTKGPTAMLKSASKIDQVGTYSQLLNQKFLPQYLEGESKKVFADYLRTWSDLGLSHIQFNVVSRETLLDAQEHPEKYTDLVVRVSGYSAYFADLSKGLQDYIIARTEHVF